MKCDFRHFGAPRKTGKGFTLMEMAAALVIIALMTTSVVVVMNQCIGRTTNYKLRAAAFRIARDNMEKLLNTKTMSESAEFGVSDLNPEIQWETVVEVFNEPIGSAMWLQARSSASYMDTNGEQQTIEFTQWLTGLTGTQQNLVKDQKKREEEYLELYGDLVDPNDLGIDF